ncbi:Lysophospholipase L2 [Aminobacter niigataensis]|nr:Lysophospholipase L2 [Aminobacter niigataensis]
MPPTRPSRVVTSLPPGATEAGGIPQAASGLIRFRLAHEIPLIFSARLSITLVSPDPTAASAKPKRLMTDLFHEIPGNPVPERATSGDFVAHDGKRLRYALFPATSHPFKGTVILLNGRNECIEKYFETIRDLTVRGHAVATFDWRGQGASERLLRDGHRGYVRSFDHYVRDLEAFFEQIVLPDCRGPFFLLAHSSGALIALLAAPSMVNRVQRMVLVAPFLSVIGAPLSMKAISRIGTLLCWLGLGRLYAAWGPRPREGTPFEINKLTSDERRYRRNMLLYETYPELSVGGPTIAWMRAAAQASEAVREPQFMAALKVPMLIVNAGADEVVSSRDVEQFASQCRVASLLTIDGARHEILQEADIYREQLLAAFTAFVPGTPATADA